MRLHLQVALVADKKIGDFFLLYQRENLPIHVGQSERVIDHKQRNVRFVQHLLCFLDPQLSECALVVQSGGIDQDDRT